MRALLPGLVLACALGGVGAVIGGWMPALGGITAAIVLGAAASNSVALPQSCEDGIGFAEKHLLNIAVVLLGAQLDLSALTAVGGTTIGLLVLLVAGTIAAGLLVGRMFGLSPTLGLLLGVGNAVCGTSAIAAAAPILEENEGEAGVAIGVINALGTLGIVAVPAVAVALGFDAEQCAVLIGGTLQAVGHVVAAGFTVGESVGELATAVKMGRVALLVPVVVTLGLLRARTGERTRVPGFLLGFGAMATLAAAGLLPQAFVSVASGLTEVLLVVAMAAIGTRIRVAQLWGQGARALAAGLVVFIAQVALLALFVASGG